MQSQNTHVEGKLKYTDLAGLSCESMEPIGTITNYFPFLEEETVHILKDVMDQSSDYYDFVVRLGNKVCNENVSLELVYMAVLNVFFVEERSLLERLREKFEDRPEIVVWTFPLESFGVSRSGRDEIQNVLSRAIETSPPDWLLINLYQFIGTRFIETSSKQVEVLRKVESLLDSNPNLACFEAYLQILQSDLHGLEDDLASSLLANQSALELARTSDDVFLVMKLTGGLGKLLRNHNSAKAMEYTEEYNRLAIHLGIPRDMGLARHYMGIIHLVRGEYDMAIECQYAAIEVYYHDKPSSSVFHVMSILYADNEEGRQALEWANEALRMTDGVGDIGTQVVMLRALLLLGRLEDADHHLNEAHRLSLESASELDEGRFLYLRGLYELKSGNPQAAIESLEQALSIFEHINFQMNINRCLIALVQAEIQLADESGKDDSSGPWMVRLESHARKKDYPGIQMHAAILRAEFLVKQGRKVEAQQVLQDALDILDSPTVKTLRTKIEKMLDDLIFV